MTSVSESGYAKGRQSDNSRHSGDCVSAPHGFLIAWQRTDRATAAFAANDGPISTYSERIAALAPATAEISAWARGSYAGAPEAGTGE
jgi:hypothetical protein